MNGYTPEKSTIDRICSGIWIVLYQSSVFSSCLKPVIGANGHGNVVFEWSTFSLKLKCFYSKVGVYAPEYALLGVDFLNLMVRFPTFTTRAAPSVRNTNFIGT